VIALFQLFPAMSRSYWISNGVSLEPYKCRTV